MKTIIAALSIPLISLAAPLSTEEEVEYSSRMSEVIKNNRDIIFRGGRLDGLPAHMQGMSEDEIIRTLASFLFQRPGENPMSDAGVTGILNAFPDILTENSDVELRKLLAAESDPRRFHLLRINLVEQLVFRYGKSFIPEMAPMLLRDGRVGRGRGEYTMMGESDVSVGTYASIINQLKRQGASFEEPPEEMEHVLRKRILALWLKENWPGCEELEIPAQAGERKELRSGPAAAPTAAPGHGDSVANEATEDRAKSPPPWIWIGTGLILATSIVAWLRGSLAKRS